VCAAHRLVALKETVPSLKEILLTRATERLLIGANVLVLGVVLATQVRPGGSVSVAVAEWRLNRAIRSRLADQWPVLVGEGGRLDSDGERVILVEFSDYQCPFCKQAHYVLDSLVRGTPEIGIIYRHFPLPTHPAAAGAARASICAENQGRFREMDRRLFETTQWQRDTSWVREARAANVPDISQFRQCLTSATTAARLERDRRVGEALQVRATPTFFGRRGFRRGVQSVVALISLAGNER
jgi:protein-disulfide isomerase